MASNNRPNVKYVYDLPYFERKELCRILDHNDKWEELGGKYMNFDVMTIQLFRQVIMRGKSPTDELLTMWGHQNHTVLELFVLLSKMQHYQSMLTLKPFVDPQYHRLIYEGEENLARIIRCPGGQFGPVPDAASSTIKPAVNTNISQNAVHSFAFAPPRSNQPQIPLFPPHQTQPQMLKSMEVGVHNLNMPDPSARQNLAKTSLTDKPRPERNNQEEKILNTVRPPLVGLPASNEENANVGLGSHIPDHSAGIRGPPEEKENNVPPPESQKSNTRTKASDVAEASSVAESYGSVPIIAYKELVVATNGWDKTTILGKGGFGTVFKGTWKNTLVAIKRIELRGGESASSHQAQLQQSLREMRFLNSCRHDNILPLYGYSLDGDEPCLLYQFMPNGSLEDRLLCRHGTRPLSWMQRHNIARGTARGLQFLHTIGEKPLIHGDIKSANILLDQNFDSRIGDFGLAREGPNNQYTHIKVSRVHGTRPYLPDEFLRSKQISTKVDTYSFGIVLFELATGLRAYDDARARKFLKDHVEGCEEDGTEMTLVDRKANLDGSTSIELMGAEGAMGCPSPDITLGSPIFGDLLHLGKMCVKRRPADRPEMVLVLQELDGMTARMEIASRAQNQLRKNSLTPSNPYERQLFHDQWLRMSPQPTPTSVQKVPMATRLSPNHGASMIPQASSQGTGSSSGSTAPSPQIFLHQPRFTNNPTDPSAKYMQWPPPMIGPNVLLPPRIPSVQVQPPSPVPIDDSHHLPQGAHNGYGGSGMSVSPGVQSSVSIPFSEEFIPATIPGQGDSSITQGLDSKAAGDTTCPDEKICNEAVGPSQLLPLISELGLLPVKGEEDNDGGTNMAQSQTLPSSEKRIGEGANANVSVSQSSMQVMSEKDNSDLPIAISAIGKTGLF